MFSTSVQERKSFAEQSQRASALFNNSAIANDSIFKSPWQIAVNQKVDLEMVRPEVVNAHMARQKDAVVKTFQRKAVAEPTKELSAILDEMEKGDIPISHIGPDELAVQIDRRGNEEDRTFIRAAGETMASEQPDDKKIAALQGARTSGMTADGGKYANTLIEKLQKDTHERQKEAKAGKSDAFDPNEVVVDAVKALRAERGTKLSDEMVRLLQAGDITAIQAAESGGVAATPEEIESRALDIVKGRIDNDNYAPNAKANAEKWYATQVSRRTDQVGDMVVQQMAGGTDTAVLRETAKNTPHIKQNEVLALISAKEKELQAAQQQQKPAARVGAVAPAIPKQTALPPQLKPKGKIHPGMFDLYLPMPINPDALGGFSDVAGR